MLALRATPRSADGWITVSDVADRGFYLYDPEAVRPNPDGSLPAIELEVADLKALGKQRRTTLDRFAVARIWNDFEGYYRAREPNRPFPRYLLRKTCSSPATIAGG